MDDFGIELWLVLAEPSSNVLSVRKHVEYDVDNRCAQRQVEKPSNSWGPKDQGKFFLLKIDYKKCGHDVHEDQKIIESIGETTFLYVQKAMYGPVILGMQIEECICSQIEKP